MHSQRRERWGAKAPSGQRVELGFRTVEWSPLRGSLEPATGQGHGVVLSGVTDDLEDMIPALPVHCPRCDMNIGRIEPDKYFKGTVRSPIRAHTSGLAQSTQLLMTQLHRSMGDTVESSRTIVFTDSRDDAARTAAGTELNHFRDLVRQLIRRTLEADVDPVDILRRGSKDLAALTADEQALDTQLTGQSAGLMQAFMRESLGAATPEDESVIAAFELSMGGQRSRSPGRRFCTRWPGLLAIGVNPAGPDATNRLIEGTHASPATGRGIRRRRQRGSQSTADRRQNSPTRSPNSQPRSAMPSSTGQVATWNRSALDTWTPSSPPCRLGRSPNPRRGRLSAPSSGSWGSSGATPDPPTSGTRATPCPKP